MNLIGYVPCRPSRAEVGRGFEIQFFLGRRHIVDVIAAYREEPFGHVIYRDGGEHPLVPDTPSRVFVDLADQLTNG